MSGWRKSNSNREINKVLDYLQCFYFALSGNGDLFNMLPNRLELFNTATKPESLCKIYYILFWHEERFLTIYLNDIDARP